MNDSAEDTADARGGPERLDGDLLFRRRAGQSCEPTGA
jgi:hypothetical protein